MFWKKLFKRRKNRTSPTGNDNDKVVKVYVVVVQMFDCGIMECYNKSAELFVNADDAIEFMNKHQPAILSIKEIKWHEDTSSK